MTVPPFNHWHHPFDSEIPKGQTLHHGAQRQESFLDRSERLCRIPYPSRSNQGMDLCAYPASEHIAIY